MDSVRHVSASLRHARGRNPAENTLKAKPYPVSHVALLWCRDRAAPDDAVGHYGGLPLSSPFILMDIEPGVVAGPREFSQAGCGLHRHGTAGDAQVPVCLTERSIKVWFGRRVGNPPRRSPKQHPAHAGVPRPTLSPPPAAEAETIACCNVPPPPRWLARLVSESPTGSRDCVFGR